MSRQGLKVAIETSLKFPVFDNQKEAEDYFTSFRTNRIKVFNELSQSPASIKLTYQPDSLKDLERWYFELYENNSFSELGVNREMFEECMAIYFCEVIIKNHSEFMYIVEESPFAPGHFSMGITKPLTTYMISRFTDHYETPDNKLKQYIFRYYKRAVN